MKANSDCIEENSLTHRTTHVAITHQQVQEKLPNRTANPLANIYDRLQKIKEMLNDIIETPLDEILPDSTVEGLGIDSLLATVLFTKIDKRFNVSVSHSDFATATHVQRLARPLSFKIVPSPSSHILTQPQHQHHNLAPHTQALVRW